MSTQETQSIASLSLAPSGILHIAYHPGGINSHADDYQTSIIQAFMQSQAQGLLQLLSAKTHEDWSLALKYWRNFISLYVEQLCHHTRVTHKPIDIIPPPDETILQEWLLKLPPMPGGEYATVEILASIWVSFDRWCREQINAEPEGTAGFIKNHLPSWQIVGRVLMTCHRSGVRSLDGLDETHGGNAHVVERFLIAAAALSVLSKHGKHRHRRNVGAPPIADVAHHAARRRRVVGYSHGHIELARSPGREQTELLERRRGVGRVIAAHDVGVEHGLDLGGRRDVHGVVFRELS